MNYESSLPDELRSEIDRVPVAYLPWGAHEWHGPHLPASVDGVKARYLAEKLCDEVGGVVFPVVYCGHDTVQSAGFPFCIDFSAEVLEKLCREYLDQLVKMGFRVIVLVIGHWGRGHITTIRQVAKEFNQKQNKCRAWVVQDNEMTDPFGYPEDHGGIGETSYMMAAGENADLSKLPEDRNISFEKDGIAGDDPRDGSSVEYGLAATEIYVREAAKIVRDMISGM